MSSVRFNGYAGGYRTGPAHSRRAVARQAPGERGRSRSPAEPSTLHASPLYARVLRLRAIRPGGLLCFVFFEGMIMLGALLALAELTSWWAVPVLPAAVAAMVKLNDVIAALLAAVPPQRVAGPLVVARGRAAVVPAPRPRPEPGAAPRKAAGTNQRRFDRPTL